MKVAKLFQMKERILQNFQHFFFFVANIVSDFQVPNIQEDVPDIRSNHDLVLVAVNTLQNHPSVVNIKHKEFNSTLSFKNTNESLAR